MRNLALMFRVVEKETRVQIPGCFFLADNGTLFLFDDEKGPIQINIEMRGWNIERCTGLKDRNGKMIYENDILQWFGHDVQSKITWNSEHGKFDWGILHKMPQDAFIVSALQKRRGKPVRGTKKHNSN